MAKSNIADVNMYTNVHTPTHVKRHIPLHKELFTTCLIQETISELLSDMCRYYAKHHSGKIKVMLFFLRGLQINYRGKT